MKRKSLLMIAVVAGVILIAGATKLVAAFETKDGVIHLKASSTWVHGLKGCFVIISMVRR